MTTAVSSKPLHARNIGALRLELGITVTQAERWNAFATALEELQIRRLELEDRERNCAMDAPADVNEVISMQVTWAQTQLSTLNLLMQRTQSLCEVLNARQRQKANRLLQSLTLAVA